MDGLLSKNIVTPGEFRDSESRVSARKWLRFPSRRSLYHPPSLIRRDFIQTTRTFCSFGDAPISREKLTADLRGVTRIGFTYLLTRHRRCCYYAPSARYFTRRSVTFSPPPLPPSLPTRVDRAYEISELERPSAITMRVIVIILEVHYPRYGTCAHQVHI